MEQIKATRAMIEAQSFQSLLQLGVAANVGFAAVLTFQGDTLAKEKRSLDSLLESAKIFRDEAIQKNKFDAKEQRIFSEVVQLRADLLERLDTTHSGIMDTFRGISLLLALISFGFLFYASAFPNESAGWILIAASTVGNIPLLLYMVHLFIQSIHRVAPIRRKRVELDRAVSAGLLELM